MALKWSTRVCGAKINNAPLLPIVSFFFWNFRPPALLEITGNNDSNNNNNKLKAIIMVIVIIIILWWWWWWCSIASSQATASKATNDNCRRAWCERNEAMTNDKRLSFLYTVDTCYSHWVCSKIWSDLENLVHLSRPAVGKYVFKTPGFTLGSTSQQSLQTISLNWLNGFAKLPIEWVVGHPPWAPGSSKRFGRNTRGPRKSPQPTRCVSPMRFMPACVQTKLSYFRGTLKKNFAIGKKRQKSNWKNFLQRLAFPCSRLVDVLAAIQLSHLF